MRDMWSTNRRLWRAAIGTMVLLPASGCSKGVLDPAGPIAASEKLILFNALAIMLAIVIPTILATLGVAWWFRASNTRATYLPDWEYSGRIEMIVWAIPRWSCCCSAASAGSAATISIRPSRWPPPSSRSTVEVVSLDWKWLFIYPDQGVASVNKLVVPAGTPISFKLTSASVWNSFFVPQLGTQIYTMAGMTTRSTCRRTSPASIPACPPISAGMVFPTCVSTSMR